MDESFRVLTVLHWRPWGPHGPGSLMYTTGRRHCPCHEGEAARRLYPLAGSPTGGALSAAAVWARPAGATPHSQLYKHKFSRRMLKSATLTTIKSLQLIRQKWTHAPATGRGWSSAGWWWSSGWGFSARPPLICLFLLGSGWSNSAPLVWRVT